MSSAGNEGDSGESGSEAPAQSIPTRSRVRSGLAHARSTLDKKRIVLQKRAKQRYRKIGQKIHKKKQTVIQWLGSGVAHYYLKFLGLWKPETSMGVVSDIARLQDEQQRIMTEFASKADLNRNLNEPIPGKTKIPDHLKDNPE
jgi:hypothetical protein